MQRTANGEIRACTGIYNIDIRYPRGENGISSVTRLKIQPNLRRTEFLKKQKGTKRVVIEIPVSHAPWEAKQEVKMKREGEGEIEVKKEKKMKERKKESRIK